MTTPDHTERQEKTPETNPPDSRIKQAFEDDMSAFSSKEPTYETWEAWLVAVEQFARDHVAAMLTEDISAKVFLEYVDRQIEDMMEKAIAKIEARETGPCERRLDNVRQILDQERMEAMIAIRDHIVATLESALKMEETMTNALGTLSDLMENFAG
jgi:hypothetical protein